MLEPAREYPSLDTFRLSELEAVRLVLRGGSVIDWHRLNFESREEAYGLLRAQEFDLSDSDDLERIEKIKQDAIAYLRRNFDFPVPKPVANADICDLLMMASGRGHRQLCACTILKVMHIIHHLEARELLFMLPTSDQEVFHMVEQKVYRVVGWMLSSGFPIVEFIGGRKNKDSLYTKLLAKQKNIAAQIYDKLRFRVITRSSDDIFPTLAYLMRHVFPFNYVIPGESKNNILSFRRFCESHEHLRTLLPRLQIAEDIERDSMPDDNTFTSGNYRVVHFVVDMPVRLPDAMFRAAPESAKAAGKVIFVQVEFQIIDQASEKANELGDASHAAYKVRQRQSVTRRLKLGISGQHPSSLPPPPRDKE